MKKLFRRLFPDKEMREYNKMHRRHRKELVKLAKETGEWDSSWLHRMVIMQVKHMHEYYSNGNNVWQTDETRLPIIEELKYVLDLEDELERLENYHCGLEFVYDGDKIVGHTVPDDFLERFDKQEARERELYEEIYSYIGKNIRNWWD